MDDHPQSCHKRRPRIRAHPTKAQAAGGQAQALLDATQHMSNKYDALREAHTLDTDSSECHSNSTITGSQQAICDITYTDGDTGRPHEDNSSRSGEAISNRIQELEDNQSREGGSPESGGPPLQRRQSRSRRASGPAPKERGRPVTGRYFPRLFQLFIFRPGGFSSAFSPGRSAWPYPGPQPQSGSKISGPSQRRAARVRGGPHRGRAQAVPSVRADRRLRLRMGNRPIRRARPPITNRAAGPRQLRAARVLRESAPGPRPRPSGLAGRLVRL
ncbi:hypothetical protein NDU88_000740 [Pleurodeles waltl]|uniref:Uncharacterized protein n=1 Tax=Pleurodeles waltl TaxID=8319 RepID=A0AAV7LVL1_PLEWA|nr:hypothetical protein NDU88_000740 [Pleurodeles waltl]